MISREENFARLRGVEVGPEYAQSLSPIQRVMEAMKIELVGDGQRDGHSHRKGLPCGSFCRR